MTASASAPSDRLASSVEADAFRSIMGTVCQQVTVIGTRARDGRPHGTTVTAFASLSLRPPMVSVALDRESRLLAHVSRTRRISVSLLSHEQEDVAMLFATKADGKADSTAWTVPDGDLPFVAGAAGWLICEVVEFVSGGDHVVLFCLVTDATQVTDASQVADRRPLVYSHRRFGTNSGLSG